MKAFEPAGMTFTDFHNGLRILINLDLQDLRKEGLFPGPYAAKDKDGWISFRDNPWRYLIKCSDKEAAMIWAAMQKRMMKS